MTDEKTMRSEMNFIVGASGGARKGTTNFDLRHELNLVKAALLYADNVKLVSIGASMLYGFVTLSEVPPDQRLALVRKHGGHRLSREQLAKMDLVMGAGPRRERRTLSKGQRKQVRRQLQEVADATWPQIVREAEERFAAYKAHGLEDAVNSGHLELHTFEGNTVEGMFAWTAEDFTVDSLLEDVVAEYVQEAGIAIEGSGYPLFDDQIGRLVNEAVQKGLINPAPASVHQGRHGGLAGDLLGRLPLFEEATVAEVLDVRQELERYLRGFRSAVSDFSRKIQSAAWEAGFAGEADVLFREKVEPEVENIEEAVRESRSLSELGRRVLSGGGLTAAALGVVIGYAQNLPVLASLVMGLGTSGAHALVSQHNRLREIRGNQLYFYYGAREMLDRPEQK